MVRYKVGDDEFIITDSWRDLAEQEQLERQRHLQFTGKDIYNRSYLDDKEYLIRKKAALEKTLKLMEERFGEEYTRAIQKQGCKDQES